MLQCEKINLKDVPCLLYLHSQGGCRLQGKNLAYYCGEKGYAFCLMDFEGSGMSSGNFVSLGHFEKTQVELVVNHLTDYYRIGMVALWGRSMGAVTALLYAEENVFRIGAIVVDSPFSSLTKMVQDIAYEQYNIPGFLANIGISIISSSIKERLGVDLFEELDPYKAVAKCKTPVLFLAASEDGLVRPKRINQLYKHYGSAQEQEVKKQYLECSGNHTDERSMDIIDSCFAFIEKELDAYREEKAKFDRRVFDMNKYVRLIGVKNATLARKVIAMDKRGNIKVAKCISSASKLKDFVHKSGKNNETQTDSQALRDATNITKPNDNIAVAIDLLKRSRVKNSQPKFQQSVKENTKLYSHKPQPKILQSDVEVWPLQRYSKTSQGYAKPPQSPSIPAESPQTGLPIAGMTLKHCRTKSMTGIFSNIEIDSPVVSTPSFLGRAKGSANNGSGQPTLYSRQNSTTNLYAETDGKMSVNVSRDQSVNESKKFTPVKVRIDDSGTLQGSHTKLSSYSKSARKLETLCKQPPLLGNPGFRNKMQPQTSFEINYQSNSFRVDSNLHDQSDWRMFGFDSHQNFGQDHSQISENRTKIRSMNSQVGYFGF